MRTALRRSPVELPARAAATEQRDGWTVVLRYEGEERHGGPWLVDLSHRRRWDYQDRNVGAHTPMDLPVPPEFGEVGIHGPFVINRMNRTQAAIWHLGAGSPPKSPPSGRPHRDHRRPLHAGLRRPRRLCRTGTPDPPRPFRSVPRDPLPHPGSGAARTLPDRHFRARPGRDVSCPRPWEDFRPCRSGFGWRRRAADWGGRDLQPPIHEGLTGRSAQSGRLSAGFGNCSPATDATLVAGSVSRTRREEQAGNGPKRARTGKDEA